MAGADSELPRSPVLLFYRTYLRVDDGGREGKGFNLGGWKLSERSLPGYSACNCVFSMRAGKKEGICGFDEFIKPKEGIYVENQTGAGSNLFDQLSCILLG